MEGRADRERGKEIRLEVHIGYKAIYVYLSHSTYMYVR